MEIACPFCMSEFFIYDGARNIYVCMDCGCQVEARLVIGNKNTL